VRVSNVARSAAWIKTSYESETDHLLNYGSEETSLWLSGWQYRKSHVIGSASGAGTNYQVQIEVHYGSGTDSGENVYCNDHCRTDFGDIRFTDNDGQTLLDYWMEEKVNSDYAVFWVKVSHNLSINPATIYIYYGNPDATTTSNGTATFLLFDDFLGTSLNTALWNTYGTGSYSLSGGTTINLTASSGYSFGLMSNVTFGLNTRVMSRMCSSIVAISSQDSEAGVGFRDSTGNNAIKACRISEAPYNTYFTVESTVAGTSTYVNSTLPQDSAWHVFSVYRTSSSNGTISIDGDYQATATTNVPSGQLSVCIANAKYGGTTSVTCVDWIAAMKYVNPEPSQGAWGSEENPGRTYDYVLKVVNQVTHNWQVNLKVYNSFNVSRLMNATISLHDGTTSDQIIVSGGTITQSEGPLYNLAGNATVYISISNLEANASGTSYIYVNLKILTPNTSTYAEYVITFKIT
jgi:hypothetical protein